MKISDIRTLGGLFRYRPLAVEAVERAVGGRCWEWLDQGLPAFCDFMGLLPSALLDHVAGLPPVPADTPWSEKPLYYLVDFLTANHRLFREKTLPDLRRSLDLQGLPLFPDRYLVDLILQDLQAFERVFTGHMAEEEEVLFPEILHGEALLRHGLRSPAAQPGNPFKLEFLGPTLPDEVFGRMIADIAEKARNQRVSPAFIPRFEGIRKALSDFQGDLAGHTRLEIGELLPRAALVEQALR